jgi:LEA14-like dessication related protein
MRRSTRLAVVPVFLVLSVSLAAPLGSLGAGSPREDISLALKEKVIRNLSSSGLVLAFHVAVTNKAKSDRELVRYRYRVLVNRKEFLNMSVTLDQPISLPGGRDTLVALPVKISYPLLFESVGPIEDKALCDLVGEMFFAYEKKREEKVGFAFPGEFPIFKDPEVDFLPLKVNDLTVGGADIVFRPRFRNLNRYDLLIDRISYRLSFGDKEVQSGLIPGDKSLPPSGDKEFSLPFIIDFFEAGKDMRELFQKPAMPCRLAGEIEIGSVWGRLLISFDKAQTVPIEKTT